MAQEDNYFAKYRNTAQPVPVRQIAPIQPIITDPAKAAEAEMRAREEQRDVTRLGVTLQGEADRKAKEQFDRLTTYRKEFLTEPTVRQFREVQNATQQIVELAKRESDQPGPGDIALIISFMKALDPGSVVRETEFATAENAGGIPETVRNAYNKLLSGGRLTPEIKREFASTATAFYNSRLGPYNTFAEDYRGLISAEGGDPDAQGIRLAEPIEFGAPPSPLTQSGAGGAPLSIVTEEESAVIFGEPRFDANGNPVGRGYQGETFRKDGTPGPFMGAGEGNLIQDPRANMGLVEGAVETVTGSERSTPEIEALPDIGQMPAPGLEGFMASLGTMMTSPEETARIMVAQFPGTQVRQDAKGNFILRSPIDGQEYAIKPGFRATDIPRAIGSVAAFTPAGRAATIPSAFAANAATQAGMEALQAGAGGNFNAEEVLIAGGAGAAGQQLSRLAGAGRARMAGGGGEPPAPIAPPPEAPPVKNRLYSEKIGGPEFKPGDELPAFAQRNVRSQDEIDAIVRDGYMLPRPGSSRSDKYFTMTDNPNPPAGNQSGRVLRVRSENVPFDRAVAAKDVEIWDNAAKSWKPLLGETAETVPGEAVAGGGAVVPDASQIISAGEREGVRVLTTDVRPPTTWLGRWFQQAGEKIPVIGTAGLRAEQQQARIAMIEKLANDFETGSANIDDVTADFMRTRGAKLNGFVQKKREAMASVAGGPQPDVNAAAEVLDQAIARLEGKEAFAPLKSKLETWRGDLMRAESLDDIEMLRTVIGDTFEDESMKAFSRTMRNIVDGPDGLYGAINRDMGDYIKANGGEQNFLKWRAANEELSGMAGELENATLKRVLSKGEATPEEAASLLFSKKPSEVKALFSNLSDAGKQRARSLVVAKIIDDAGGIGTISTARFTTALKKAQKTYGVAFPAEDVARFDGMLRLMQVTQRAERAADVLPTGQQLVPFAAFSGLSTIAGTMGGWPAASLVGGGALVGFRGFESKAMRNLLVALSKTRVGSEAERNVLRMIGKAMPAPAAVTATPNNSEQPPAPLEFR